MSLTLGARKHRSVYLSDEQRSRHIHVLGASGTGKSKLLESLIRQDILSGRGLCLIDPHGTLAEATIAWCAALGIENYRHVHVLDLSEPRWIVGFNPVGVRPGEQIEPRVDAMVAACAEVWGGEDLDRTPLLATSLQLIFYALAANGLTLAEALSLTAASNGSGLREALTAKLQNGVYADYWREYEMLSRKDFEERFASARRRLLRFLASPTIRRVVGQRERSLDLRAIMDRGDILIVNLRQHGEASEENGRLVGALLLNELRLCAMGRDAATAQDKPFSLYVDECYDFLTGDVERMLDQTRKFGLHVVLAHQRLGQLRARSDAIYNGVMAGGQNKIVFGGLTDDDAEIMVREIMRGDVNLERPKHVLDKSTVVDEVPFWLESESSTRGESATDRKRKPNVGRNDWHILWYKRPLRSIRR